jgi:hypothetical protein
MVDGIAWGIRPGDDIVEGEERRLAIEVCHADRLAGAEKVIGRHHRHGRLFV